MHFAFDYAKHKSKPRNAGFYFDIETPRGHLFTVLDFAPHDYANLNPSLQGKLETIVGSFESVSSSSADLFLGFLAKEINNFVHNLAEQSGGPELSCSAALCLVSGARLSYFLSGDAKISILQSGRLQPLQGDEPGGDEHEKTAPAQLGANKVEAPLSDQVRSFTLQDDDLVLIMTRGVAETFENQESPADRWNLLESDVQVLCDSLMKASSAGGEDRMLVVISGPYQRLVEPGLAEPSQIEQKLGEQFAALKDDLRNKAATIDLLELDEKVKNLSATLAAKAGTAEVLELRRDVLRLGLVSTAGISTATSEPSEETELSTPPALASAAVPRYGNQTPFGLRAALTVLVISLAAGFVGGWLGSRRNRTAPEVWSVKTSGNQITIGRKDGTNSGNVTLVVAQPLKSTGEQTFSSYADVQRYIDTITNPAIPFSQTSQSNPPTPSTPAAVTEITVKPGDSLKKLAQVYNVPEEKLMELNPGITRWPLIQIGQKIVVPSPSASPTPVPAPPAPSAQGDQSPANTTEVTVGPGDSLNELARRFNTTAERLKELNPRMNWPRIQSGQKVLVPTRAGN